MFVVAAGLDCPGSKVFIFKPWNFKEGSALGFGYKIRMLGLCLGMLSRSRLDKLKRRASGVTSFVGLPKIHS